MSQFSLASPATTVLGIGYDKDGLVSSLGGLAPTGLSIVRSPTAGLLLSMTSGSPAVAEAMSYDGFGAPTQFSGTLNGTPVGGVTLAYDGAGRIPQKNDAWAFPMVVPQPPMSTAEWTYTYDEAGRLATATRTGEATRTYTYDARGNRSAISPSEDPAKAPDEQDRMPQVGHPGDADYTTYTYDDHGNVTDRTADGVTHKYRWDGEGSLLGVKQGGPDIVTYDVDAKGRRVGRRVGTNLTHQWFYDGQLRIVGEVVYGTTPSYRVYGYVGERHLPVTMVETKGAITSSYRIFGDHLGSLRAVVRTSGTVGQVVQSMRHGPWGELEAEWLDAGFARVPFGFAGGVFETVTGLVRFGAREYDPRTGRWLSKDDWRFAGGMNFFAYVSDDPVNKVDPTGRREAESLMCEMVQGKNAVERCWDRCDVVFGAAERRCLDARDPFAPASSAPGAVCLDAALEAGSDCKQGCMGVPKPFG